jgi:uncharacterized protein (TIGR02147 family)
MPNSENFRSLLESELRHRQNRRNGYSIRDFARDLSLEHSFLAKILNGTRAVTPLTIQRVAPQLGLTPETSSLYQEAVLQKRIQKPRKKLGESNWLNVIPVEQFDPVSEWYFTAILTLISLPNFENRPQWIAKSLNISVNEAEMALERLKDAGYYRIRENGKCEVLQKQNSVLPKTKTTANLKRYQKQTLFKAIQALEATPLDLRDHAIITVATTQARIESAKPLIKSFRRKLMRFLEDVESPDTVYDFSTALFPISNRVRKSSSR